MAKRSITTQEELPGIESEKIPAIEKAAKALQEMRSERIGLPKIETERAATLIELLKEHKIEEYRCQTFEARVRLKHGDDKVSVKTPNADDADNGESVEVDDGEEDEE